MLSSRTALPHPTCNVCLIGIITLLSMGKNRVLHLSWLCGNKIFGKHHQEMSSYPDLLANQGVYVPFFLLGYVSHLEKGHGFNVEEQNLWLGVSPIYPLPVLRIRNCALNLYTCIPIGKDFCTCFFIKIPSNPFKSHIYTRKKKHEHSMEIPFNFQIPFTSEKKHQQIS